MDHAAPDFDYIKAKDEARFARLDPRFDSSRADVAEQYHVVMKWLYSSASACTSLGHSPGRVGLEQVHGDDIRTRITVNGIQFAETWVVPIGEQLVIQVSHAVGAS
jgi:hypothetical protein